MIVRVLQSVCGFPHRSRFQRDSRPSHTSTAPPIKISKPKLSGKGQVSIYIIVAIVLALSIIFFVTIRTNVSKNQIPQSLNPIFDYYESCIQNDLITASKLAGEGGGRIFVQGYVPGSEYAPFASHLNFLGSPIQYWYSLAGNGLVQESVPTKQEIEKEMGEYVADALKDCDFAYYRSQGFNVSVSEPDVRVEIFENKIQVTVDSEVSASRGDEAARKENYAVEITSKLGKFYNTALDIYNEQKQKAFLESYAVDVLYNYAPVTGVELQCGPKIWLTREVTDSLREGLSQNIQTIKMKGDYYDIQKKEREYFVYDKEVDEAVNFLYFPDWPSKIEIHGEGVDDELMMTDSVGTQAGMGIMGFCYVPYHFVYDIEFPVLIQLYDTDELFQFPVVAIIDKNVPRSALPGEQISSEEGEFDLCQFMNKDVTINLYDSNLNKVNGNVSFECFDQRCRLGETHEGSLRTPMPACVNGYVFVRAEGFADKQQLLSSNTETFTDVILEREYSLDVALLVGGRNVEDETAIVSFTRDDGEVKTVALPEIHDVKLSEGSYEVKVYVYGNSSVRIPASTKTQCTEVPKEGLLGLFGSTKEKCFDITLPETKLENSLIGGGVSHTYMLESELKKGKIILSVDKLPVPTTLDQLAQNFELFETKQVGVNFDGV